MKAKYADEESLLATTIQETEALIEKNCHSSNGIQEGTTTTGIISSRCFKILKTC
jgi:hypothetical protein